MRLMDGQVRFVLHGQGISSWVTTHLSYEPGNGYPGSRLQGL
ncbi:MAG TPA: hypothetical protein VMS89_06510 [Methanoregulaceae archaeon]|nr:hypothetical protein [Methanoregulaceae archaeon]